jgi:formylglycine-generating enzyme required for sulfatase activity
MNRLFPLLLLLTIVGLGASGCGLPAATIQDATATSKPTATPQAAVVPTEVPTVQPSRVPTVVTTAIPPEMPTEEPAPAGPPATASLGDTWTRPADGMSMVYVPAGEFEMGSNDPFYNNERPPHPVALGGFWLDQTEVTNAQYRRCVEAGICKPPATTHSFTRPAYYDDPAYDGYPIIYVNWYRAVAYCKWAGGRLPTEEEWEYAARGPESRWYPWGDMPDKTRANYCDATCPLQHADQGIDDGYPDTAPVGSYPAGASWCAALDMVGNVWEWVWDWYGFYPSEENPEWLASDMQDRVIRGGSWDTAADHARCTFRSWFNPVQSHDSIGFRCALSPAQ